MRRVDADDEFLASVTGKLHFKLAPFLRLIRPCAPFFLGNLVVEPLTNPDGPPAHGGLRFCRINGQEFGQHRRCLPVRHHASQPCRQFHQLGRRPIGADFFQRREGSGHARVTSPAQLPAGIAHLDSAEHRSDPARRIILDRPERVAIRADPAKEGIGLRLVAHDRALKRRHDLLARFDRQADFSVEQALPALINANLPTTDLAELVLPLDRDRPLHRHRHLLEQSDDPVPFQPNNPYSTPEKLPVSNVLKVLGRNLTIKSKPTGAGESAHDNDDGAVSGWEEHGPDWRGFSAEVLKSCFALALQSPRVIGS